MSENKIEQCNLASKICKHGTAGIITGIAEYIQSVVGIKTDPSRRLLDALQHTAEHANHIIDENNALTTNEKKAS